MRIISLLIIIFFPAALILINYKTLVFNSGFYKSEFKKLGVYQKFSSAEVADLESENLIGYLCCAKNLNESFYSQREVLHLKDVRKLMAIVDVQTVLFLIALSILTAALFLKKEYYLVVKSYKLASIFTICAIFTIFVLAQFNFDTIFVNFHYLSFNNDYWLLPPDANLIKMFPQTFFVDFANRVAVQTLIISAAIFAAAWLISKKHGLSKH